MAVTEQNRKLEDFVDALLLERRQPNTPRTAPETVRCRRPENRLVATQLNNAGTLH